MERQLIDLDRYVVRSHRHLRRTFTNLDQPATESELITIKGARAPLESLPERCNHILCPTTSNHVVDVHPNDSDKAVSYTHLTLPTNREV